MTPWHELSPHDREQSQPVLLATAILDVLAAERLIRLVRVDAPPPPPPAHPRRPRMYASRYVGVAKVHGRYVGAWGRQSGQQGPRRPLTPDGEEQAAWDRARALGRDYIEVRDAS